jgi:hypothetical protein
MKFRIKLVVLEYLIFSSFTRHDNQKIYDKQKTCREFQKLCKVLQTLSGLHLAQGISPHWRWDSCTMQVFMQMQIKLKNEWANSGSFVGDFHTGTCSWHYIYPKLIHNPKNAECSIFSAYQVLIVIIYLIISSIYFTDKDYNSFIILRVKLKNRNKG